MIHQRIAQALPSPFGSPDNLLLDFGPKLKYTEVCEAYTLERLSLWKYTDGNNLNLVALRKAGLPTGRCQGTLYLITDPDDMRTLDSEREVGVKCDRIRMKILVPYLNASGKLTQVTAHVYIQRTEVYKTEIVTDNQKGRIGKYITNDTHNYKMVKRIADPNPVLNQRFSFYTPPYPTHPVNQDVLKGVAQHVAKRNRQQSRRTRARYWWNKLICDE